MLPYRVSNPGPLTYESGALPIALCCPVRDCEEKGIFNRLKPPVTKTKAVLYLLSLKHRSGGSVVAITLD